MKTANHLAAVERAARDSLALDDSPEVAARLAFYARAMEDAARALAEPDPDLDHEREEIAKAQRNGA
jgi:hypothetical protein